jgi:hypothetical protein
VRVSRVISALALSFVLLTGSTGCWMSGDRGMNEQTTKQSNLAMQRESALALRTDFPNVETIRFTDEGGTPPVGSWRVEAVATVAGVDYQVVIDPSNWVFPTGDMPPESATPPTPVPLTVIYSDGTSEMVK